MPISMFQTSVPVFLRTLHALSGVLDKGETHARENGVDSAALLAARLAPDMFPLTRQVQVATDHAKGATARLAGRDVPSFEDTEQSFSELRERIGRTVAFIREADPASIDGSEEREIVLKIGGRELTLAGQQYLLHFALPNFFFHTTTAYDILRHNGVPLGKRDFIGMDRPAA